jgi:hypothetical protein
MEFDRCQDEIATIEALIIAGHPDLHGLCLALSDWNAELRLIEREMDQQTKSPPQPKPGRAQRSGEDVTY